MSLLTWKNVQSLMEIRRPLELMSYDLAVQKMTDQDVRDLEHIYVKYGDDREKTGKSISL